MKRKKALLFFMVTCSVFFATIIVMNTEFNSNWKTKHIQKSITDNLKHVEREDSSEIEEIYEEELTTMNTDTNKKYNNFNNLQLELEEYLKDDAVLFQSVLINMQKEGKINLTSIKRPDYNIFNPIEYDHGAAIFNDTMFNREDFQFQKPIIPHIIHQIWESYKVPSLFTSLISSIIKHHPGWEYWFWTLEDAECLIRRSYPEYLSVYTTYAENSYKIGAIRYFVLHAYGGIFIDLDVEALKPLDFWTYAFPAVLTYENYEHSYLHHRRDAPNLMNGVMASKPQHPFFKMLLNGLEQYSKIRNALHVTGSFYLQTVYETYLQSEMHNKEASSVMTIHPKYWLPKWDKTLQHFKSECERKTGKLSFHGEEICLRLEANNYLNKGNKEAYLEHYWAGIYQWEKKVKQQHLYHIKDIVPHVKIIETFINCQDD